MSTTIVMPQLGESVAEGIIGKWLKGEGDQVERDEPIVEVITDKVNAEIPSPVAGVLEKITQPEGATVAVGQEIAVIGDGGARQPEPARAGSIGGDGQQESSQTVSPTPTAVESRAESPDAETSSGGAVAVGAAPEQPPGERPLSERSSGEQLQRASTVPPGHQASNGRGERVRSSPLVRRLAEQHGIDLAEVAGTGIGGRVSKQDIMSFIERKQQATPAAVATQAPPSAPSAPPRPPSPGARQLGPGEELVPISPVRKMIADRMTLSTSTIPHATTIVEVDVTNVVRYRETKKDEFRRQEGIPLSYVAFMVKATVEALKEYPMVNAEWSDGGIILKKDININVAVDAPEGLTTPVIHHADQKSLAGLSAALVDLAERARNRKLKIEDMQGGTFTVNNTGALGSVWSMSIINHPQGGILAFAAIVKRPVVIEQDGQDLFAVRHMMNVSFSFDHRLLDGGYAASFLNAVKQKLESWSMDYPLF